MRHQFCWIMILLIIFTSCNSQSERSGVALKDTNSTNTDSVVVINVTGCYMHVQERDTVIASLIQNGKQITGKLIFDNYQIDGSSGTLNGILDGDILKLKYDFFSEGMNSLMEIYFKYQNNSLIRGIGDMKISGDSFLFTEGSSVKYPNETVLKKIPCEEVNL